MNSICKATAKGLAKAIGAAGIWAAAVPFNLAQAVNSLPGGPAVNQLNLHPANLAKLLFLLLHSRMGGGLAPGLYGSAVSCQARS